MGENLMGIDFRMTRGRGSGDWLWANHLSCVVKEKTEVKGHLERVMRGSFMKVGKLTACSQAINPALRERCEAEARRDKS